MSNGPVPNPLPVATPIKKRWNEELHGMDWLAIAIIAALFVWYIIFLVMHHASHEIDWAALMISGAFCFGLLIGGYIFVRKSESHHGEASSGEMIGVIMIGLGFGLIAIGALPDWLEQQLRGHLKAIKPLPLLQDPIVQAVEANGVKTVSVSRIGAIADKDETQVFIMVVKNPELVNNELRANLALPPGNVGKVWYQVRQRESGTADF